MAASEDEEKRSAHAFLMGHGLLVLGYIFFTVGFATDYWLTTTNDHYGLWEMCTGQVCVIVTPGDYNVWMEVTRAMQTLALMSYMGGVLAALYVHCFTYTLLHTTRCLRRLHGKARVLEVCTALGCAFCLTGVSVYGSKMNEGSTVGYSYGLTVFSLFLTTIGTFMVAASRNEVTLPNRVTPQQQTGGAASSGVSTISDPRSRPAVNGASGSYPYGQGQHHRWASQQPPGSSHRDAGLGHGGVDPYPYGRGAGNSLAPSNLTPLSYPLHPPEPGSNLGSLTMPEPGPIGGGGGEGGLGLPPRGQSRGPGGRLPPISEVSPSAPPPPPPEDGDQPPSYLEAIGHHAPHP